MLSKIFRITIESNPIILYDNSLCTLTEFTQKIIILNGLLIRTKKWIEIKWNPKARR